MSKPDTHSNSKQLTYVVEDDDFYGAYINKKIRKFKKKLKEIEELEEKPEDQLDALQISKINSKAEQVDGIAHCEELLKTYIQAYADSVSEGGEGPKVHLTVAQKRQRKEKKQKEKSEEKPVQNEVPVVKKEEEVPVSPKDDTVSKTTQILNLVQELEKLLNGSTDLNLDNTSYTTILHSLDSIANARLFRDSKVVGNESVDNGSGPRASSPSTVVQNCTTQSPTAVVQEQPKSEAGSQENQVESQEQKTENRPFEEETTTQKPVSGGKNHKSHNGRAKAGRGPNFNKGGKKWEREDEGQHYNGRYGGRNRDGRKVIYQPIPEKQLSQ